MTFYFEIVGYTPTYKMIQKGFDYGCELGKFKTFIYRITYTNDVGDVFEMSTKQVQDYCNEMGITPVVEYFYGKASEYCSINDEDLDSWRNKLLEQLKNDYNEKDCDMCINKVPEEGCVIRIEGNSFEAYKCKSVRFL